MRHRYRKLALKRKRRKRRRVTSVSIAALLGLFSGTFLLEAFQTASSYLDVPVAVDTAPLGQSLNQSTFAAGLKMIQAANGRPQISPLPQAQEVWECEVIVVGGSLGGVAAASHAMRTGVQTCLIEVTPWLGGQISSQGVSAIDESRSMRWQQNFSDSWRSFKRLIRSQTITLPDWTGMSDRQWVYETNSCWVGDLCFLPEAGTGASQQWLQDAATRSPESRWATSTAFKGAMFDASGRNITAIYAVKRAPKDPNYRPEGRLSRELATWYAWSSNETFEKIPIRLQAPPGKSLIVIDATDTGELVAWAKIPYRVGSDARDLLGELSGPTKSNPACTQAFTFPFVMTIADDQGRSRQALQQLETGFPKAEHRRMFDMEGFPMFHNRGLFNYRRIVSRVSGAAAVSRSTPGEMTMVNWTRGNDWNIMDDPLIMDAATLEQSGQYQNWMGGLSPQALRNAENHALLFAEWLMETQATPDLPLTFLSGAGSPMGTQSGLSMTPYIREGRRIIGRPAYRQEEFMIREADLRVDMSGGRDFSATAIALTHYDIDIHGCRYRNWQPSYEATPASVNERLARPLKIPLEAIVPIGVDNLLIGGKSIAVSHIVNAMTRVHYGEWSVGSAAGATAGWLLQEANPNELTPAQIVVTDQVADLQTYLMEQNLRLAW
ncbi:MAG: FAD-dependent oxidoreductase [Leptolyngbya sp. SIO1D8]|nr:FAD-dependent oxidoreductase [Leptolyngbya sp. SIO1D8]